jgi:predicted dehydrogenase
MRFFASAEPTTVQSVKHELDSPQVDRATTATGKIHCDLAAPPRLFLVPRIPDLTAEIVCEKGSLRVFNYVAATMYHSITVNPTGKTARVEKAYTFPDLGEPWWTSYRYQLEAFVNKVKGRTPHTWVEREDSIANMEAIESLYAKVRALHNIHPQALMCVEERTRKPP